MENSDNTAYGESDAATCSIWEYDAATHGKILDFPVCWNCQMTFRKGLVIGRNGICDQCQKDSGLSQKEIIAVIPHVWGERLTRLTRSIEIVHGLRLIKSNDKSEP